MILENYLEIILKLHKKTNEGLVNWKATSGPSVFGVFFKDFSISISSEYSRSEQESYIKFVILNSEGIKIDDFIVYESDTQWILADELYRAARRKALKIDEAITSISKELDESKTIGTDDDDIPF